MKSAEECRYDEVSLGEVMMRIDPENVSTARARFARTWHSGGETNMEEGGYEVTSYYEYHYPSALQPVGDALVENALTSLKESGRIANAGWKGESR